MVWVLLVGIFILMIMRNWVSFTSIVQPHQIQRSEFGDNSFSCVFYWRGRKCYGYFFYDDGEPTEDVFLQVVGIDCTSGLWCLEVYNEDNS